jgi:hypothetical protein
MGASNGAPDANRSHPARLGDRGSRWIGPTGNRSAAHRNEGSAVEGGSASGLSRSDVMGTRAWPPASTRRSSGAARPRALRHLLGVRVARAAGRLRARRPGARQDNCGSHPGDDAEDAPHVTSPQPPAPAGRGSRVRPSRPPGWRSPPRRSRAWVILRRQGEISGRAPVERVGVDDPVVPVHERRPGRRQQVAADRRRPRRERDGRLLARRVRRAERPGYERPKRRPVPLVTVHWSLRGDATGSAPRALTHPPPRRLARARERCMVATAFPPKPSRARCPF